MRFPETVGVIGAGIMGGGIAQACAVAGLAVTMIDVDDAAVARGRSAVSSSLDRLVKKEKLSSADKDAALARINGTPDYAALKACDFVIEAATENEALKVRILKQADEHAKPDAVLATTHLQFPSRSSPPAPNVRNVSSACTSSIRCP